MSTPAASSVGAMLREAREAAALTVDDVAERTRIRATLIRAIEADDFSGCGGNFYARGHVRSIATTLGEDPAPFVTRFNMQAELTQPISLPVLPGYESRRIRGKASKGSKAAKGGRGAQSPQVPQAATLPQAPQAATLPQAPRAATLPQAPQAARAPQAPQAARPPETPRADIPRKSRTPVTASNAPLGSMTQSRTRVGRVPPRRSGPRWTSALVVAAAVVAMLAVGSFVFAAVQPIKRIDAGRTQSGKSHSPPATAPSSAAPSQSSPGVTLRLVLTGTSWIRVTDGSGRQLFENVLTSGDVKDFSDPTALTVRYGNSTVVRVVLNGQDRGSPASSCGGTVCTQRYLPGPAGG